VFERNLVEKILQDHKLPAALERFMPEDAAFPLNDAVETLLGLHPSSWTLVEHTTQSIRRLAIMGNVILIGRGSNIISAQLTHVFNFRLVAPLRERVRRVGNVPAIVALRRDCGSRVSSRPRKASG
jgi:hypothetical protein